MAGNRMLIKVGTGVLTRADRIRLDETAFVDLARAVSEIRHAGWEVAIVTSGAVGAGLMEFGRTERPAETAELQAFAAIGQARLMQAWRTHLMVRDLCAAQVLLTYADLDSDASRARILRTMESLLALGGVVPIINENDSVAVEELRFGDNDALSARVAVMAGVTLLVLLTTVDGLLDSEGRLVPEIADLDAARSLVQPEKGSLSVGGMATKLEAASHAVSHGIPVVIANGKRAWMLPDIVAGKSADCTRISPRLSGTPQTPHPTPVHV